MTNTASSALIAMSGGVDSSVAAYLATKLFPRCMGATMALTTGIESCHCSAEDWKEAKKAAEVLNIDYRLFDFSPDFEREVIEPFVSVYENGGTPNPCVDCNRRLKFGKLYETAVKLGFDHIVTGHYAIVEYDDKTGRYLLKKAADTSKDQSYVLYSLTQSQLSKTVFLLPHLKD